jgi:hypothetical protein
LNKFDLDLLTSANSTSSSQSNVASSQAQKQIEVPSKTAADGRKSPLCPSVASKVQLVARHHTTQQRAYLRRQ